MSDSVDKTTLERFRRRELPRDEMARVIGLLATDESLMEEYRAMFPEIRNIDNMFGFLLTDDVPAESFHLDYDEHLLPFVDGHISQADREIVEGHIKVCSHCSGMLRDLQEFHDLLAAGHSQPSLASDGLWERIATAVRSNFGVAAFAAGLVLTISTGIIWYVLTRPAADTAVSVAPGIDETANTVPAEVMPETVVDLPAAQAPAPTAPARDEIARLELPDLLSDLKATRPGTLRGGGSSNPIPVISPNGVAIRGVAVLKWRPVSGLTGYSVAIFDDRDEQIASADVEGTSWRVPKLAKGRIYQWQVTGGRDPEAASIGQGRFYLISGVEEARIDQAGNALARGKAMAEAGMVDAAIVEFRRFLQANPDSEAAKSYLRQLNAIK